MTPEERASIALGTALQECDYQIKDFAPFIENFAQAIREAVREERNACAEIADQFIPKDQDSFAPYSLKPENTRSGQIAALIRART